MPHLQSLILHDSEPDENKATILLKERYPSQLAESIPLRAIVVPRIASNGQTATRSISAGEVFKALAPTTMLQLPGAGARALGMLARLVRRLPGYALELGTDFGENVSAIRSILHAHLPRSIKPAGDSPGTL